MPALCDVTAEVAVCIASSRNSCSTGSFAGMRTPKISYAWHKRDSLGAGCCWLSTVLRFLSFFLSLTESIGPTLCAPGSSGAPMVNFTILAGGYTSAVASYLFNTATSSLTLLNQSPTGNSPSWIALHPTNKSILYTVNEVTPGMLQSFTIGDQGVLTAVDSISSGGDGPAFATPLSTGQVAILNYGSGNGLIIPTTTDPLHFADDASLITFPGPYGPDGVSHPHMALEDKSHNEILVSDLGADKIWRLVEDGNPGKFSIEGFISQPYGSGPRHMALYNDIFYSLHELSSTLTQQVLPPPPNGTTPFIGNFSIIPPDPPFNASFAAAEILLPTPNPRFQTEYVYVSNRNTGTPPDPRGDAIVIFSTNPTLKPIKYVYTGLDQIRGMQIGGENDEYLIAGGYAAGGVAMFERVDGGADLALVARNTDLPTRTSFVWL